ncbi:Rrf2 family transcriptional regulator [Jeotgalibacillus proteolyticus]|uniref:Rrf2 family transcriptional regulator n=1 Tax=Jeotgalibacillus proteolyticus TaxID=2082395 RepID=A0A2S5GDL0_9BACL|nr:Rrf2 family transcriptional regulator [Jeotgalibacillus proteolyticus]PPA71127.1 Rrf2 family transcriptional regulator [Jeotgalibacillus proteolyticus]
MMKMKSGAEQGACILAMVGTQLADVPIKSDAISERLSASPSYLKKVMRKLVINGVINSVSGVNGGFTLAKDPKEISLYDLLIAIQGDNLFIKFGGGLKKVFPESEIAATGERILQDAFLQAETQYLESLKSISLHTILSQAIGTEEYQFVNWNEKVNDELFNQLQEAMSEGEIS